MRVSEAGLREREGDGRLRRGGAVRLFAGIVLLGLVAGAPSGRAQVSWDGDCDEDWDGAHWTLSDPPVFRTNWDHDRVPLAGDSVTIGTEGAHLPAVANIDVEVADLTVRGGLRVLRNLQVAGFADVDNIRFEADPGTISVGGLLEVGGNSLWLAGDIRAGRFVNQGVLLVDGNDASLAATTLENEGEVTAEGTRTLEEGARIVNVGTWIAGSSNASIFRGDGSDGMRFVNNGVLRRTGTGVATFDVPVTGNGRLEVRGGTLALTGGIDLPNAMVSTSLGAILQVAVPQGASARLGGFLSGSGEAHFTGPFQTIVDRLEAALFSGQGLYFAPGSLVSIAGGIDVSGDAVWQAADVYGEGRFHIATTGSLLIRSATLGTRLRSEGEVRQEGDLILEAGGRVTTMPGGRYVLENGSVRKDAEDTTFEVDGGRLTKAAGSTRASTIATSFVVGGGAEVRVEGGRQLSLLGGGEFRGSAEFRTGLGEDGRLVFGEGTFATIASADGSSTGARIRIMSSVADVRVDEGAAIVISGAGDRLELDAVGVVATGGFILLGGSLSCERGTIHNVGLLVAERGMIDGGAIREGGGDDGLVDAGFVNTGVTSITGATRVMGSFENRGIVTHGGGAVTLEPGARFRNRGVYSASGTAGILGEGAFVNDAGALTVADGTHTVACPFFADAGTVRVDPLDDEAAELTISDLRDAVRGDVLESGRWQVGSGGTLRLSGRTIRCIGGTASVSVDAGGRFPTLDDLVAVKNGASFEWAGDRRLDDAFENEGEVSIEAGELRAPEVRNRQGGEIESDLGPAPDSPGDEGFDEGIRTDHGFFNDGHVYPGGRGREGNLQVTGDFAQGSAGVIHVDLAGVPDGGGVVPVFDEVLVSGAASLDGLLVVGVGEELAGWLTGAERFPVVRAFGGRTGAFANAPVGGRLLTADGRGSFAVDYQPGAVVLTDFIRGLPPGEAPAPPAVTIAVSEDGQSVVLTIAGSPGWIHRVEDWEDPVGWNPVRDVVPDLGGTFRLILPTTDRDAATRLFRVVVPALAELDEP